LPKVVMQRCLDSTDELKQLSELQCVLAHHVTNVTADQWHNNTHL